MRTPILFLMVVCVFLSACAATQQANSEKGLIEFIDSVEIATGMPAEAVARDLGTPLSRSEKGDGSQTWIYDNLKASARYVDVLSDASRILRLDRDHDSSPGDSKVTVVITLSPEQRVQSFSYYNTDF